MRVQQLCWAFARLSLVCTLRNSACLKSFSHGASVSTTHMFENPGHRIRPHIERPIQAPGWSNLRAHSNVLVNNPEVKQRTMYDDSQKIQTTLHIIFYFMSDYDKTIELYHSRNVCVCLFPAHVSSVGNEGYFPFQTRRSSLLWPAFSLNDIT